MCRTNLGQGLIGDTPPKGLPLSKQDFAGLSLESLKSIEFSVVYKWLGINSNRYSLNRYKLNIKLNIYCAIKKITKTQQFLLELWDYCKWLQGQGWSYGAVPMAPFETQWCWLPGGFSPLLRGPLASCRVGQACIPLCGSPGYRGICTHFHVKPRNAIFPGIGETCRDDCGPSDLARGQSDPSGEGKNPWT